jgi:stalled ribosome alternative rescue factor ArfA
MNRRITIINPVAKALAQSRRRQQVVKSKKGKGSYDRNTEKNVTRHKTES